MGSKGATNKINPPLQEYEGRFNILLKNNDIKNVSIPREKNRESIDIYFEKENNKIKEKKKKKIKNGRIKKYRNTNICYYSIRRNTIVLGHILNNIYKKIKKKKEKDENANMPSYCFISSPYYYHIQNGKTRTEMRKNSYTCDTLLSSTVSIKDEDKNSCSSEQEINCIYNMDKELCSCEKCTHKKKKIKKGETNEENSVHEKVFTYDDYNSVSPETFKEESVLTNCKYYDKYSSSNEASNNLKYVDTQADFNPGDDEKSTNYQGKKEKKKKGWKYRSYKPAQLAELTEININHYKEEIQNSGNTLLLDRSTIIHALINSVRSYSNFEYVVEGKKCYSCFISLRKKSKTSTFGKCISVDDYLHMTHNTVAMKNAFSFTYGFYSRQGKYHHNEDTSSHAQFSSSNILNEIKKLLTNIQEEEKKKKIKKKIIKFNLFKEIVNLFGISAICHYPLDENKVHYESSICSYTNNRSNQKDKLSSHALKGSYGDDIYKVYLKFPSPAYCLNGYESDHSNKDYDIICNYFFDEKQDNSDKNKNIKKVNYTNKRNERKIKRKKSDFTLKCELGGLSYIAEKSQLFMNNQEEEIYCTYRKNRHPIHQCNNYKFLCKICKKYEHINSERKFDLSYFKYLYDTPGKRKEEEKNIEISEGVSKSISEGVSKSISEGVSKSISEGVSKSISEGVSKSISEGVSKSISEGVSKSISESVCKNVRKNVRKNVSTNVSTNVNTNVNKTTDAYFRFQDSDESSCSDEFNFINYARRCPNEVAKKICPSVTGPTDKREDIINTDDYKNRNTNTTLFNFVDDEARENMNRSGERKIDVITIKNNIRKEKGNSKNDATQIDGKIVNRFALNNCLIKCKTCRHIHKYDNLSNDHLLKICKSYYNSEFPFFLNMLGEQIFNAHLSNCPMNKGYLRNIIISKDNMNEYLKRIKRRNIRGRFYLHSSTDVDCYENEIRFQVLREEMENEGNRENSKNERNRENSKNEEKKKHSKCTNLLCRNTPSTMIISSNEKRDKGLVNNERQSKLQQIKEYLNDRKRLVFEKYFSSIREAGIKEEHTLKKGKIIEHCENVTSNFDMHFFTICDGHGDTHASLFLIQNAHKIFYYLLINTFFSIHFSLKILSPLLDLLYYIACYGKNVNTYSGSCIINVLLRKNYIYVNNTGDSKCALVTFNLDKFEHKEKEQDEMGKGVQKKKQSRKGRGKKREKGSNHNISHSSVSSGTERAINTDYHCYDINLNSISYNELNSEHNCNNYSEYLRMYKAYYYNSLRKEHMKTKEQANVHIHTDTKIGMKVNSSVIYENACKEVCSSKEDECDDNFVQKKKIKKKSKGGNSKGTKNDEEKREKDNKKKDAKKNIKRNAKCNAKGKTRKHAELDNDLNEKIAKINDYILREDGKQVSIGNFSNELIKLNRLDGCLHPSRVIGDYDLKKKYYNNEIFILSNNSNIYKYNLNNVNFFNNIHYFYTHRNCTACNESHVLCSYGKINLIDNIILSSRTELLLQKKNKLKTLNQYYFPNHCPENLCDSSSLGSHGSANIYNGQHELVEAFMKIYKDDTFKNADIRNCVKNKTENIGIRLKEQFSPYIDIKSTTLNGNCFYKKDKKNFFHFLIIASDGVFEFINPLFILNILKNNKSVYKKIQKIYKIYNTYNNSVISHSKSNEEINSRMHKYMITKKECTKLAKDIVKCSVSSGNFDDSTCFCIFLFPTLFFTD
ncbi:protein phosphatase [Plasmodium brasilianum]|uniref:Protein phosphatase n=1 Tax=Plasmodium brasilianum TaxID=5824 RepID=A0ACB9Y8X3_PLABR|nr:protein phosphatase [Plasmodium brasilianum]